MNLLDEAWIPVRRSNGEQDWISLYQITDPTIIALDARRADFNGALIQFLIGLIQTTTPMDSEVEWKQWNELPPSAEELKAWFEPVRDAFVFDGDGARFMQDFELRTEYIKNNDGGWRDISNLLIDTPAGKSLDDNTDHFVKRNLVSSACAHCTATALFTLQINAPEGGRGHYTSIRGGGPLTTLLTPSKGSSLWQNIWLNIIPTSQFKDATGSAQLEPLKFKFPWLGTVASVQPSAGKLTPIQAHPAHMFWGMPRKIRLDEQNLHTGKCDICERYSKLLYSKFVTKPNGLNYKHGWSHVLSPYYESKNSETKQMEWLAVHPQQGGVGYKDWFGLLLGVFDPKRKRRPASVVTHFLNSSTRKKAGFSLWSFGYDMDSNKACCWYEGAFPLYGLAEKNTDELSQIQREVECWLKAADEALYFLASAVKSSWFSRSPDGKLDIRGDFSFIDTKFWSQTEAGFYQLLRVLIEQARNEDDDIIFTPLREQWRSLLIKTAIHLFDADLVGAAPIAQQNPRRTAEAYNRLCASLRGDKLKETLKLPTEKKIKKSKKDAA